MLVLVGIEPCHSRKYFFFLILKEYSPKNNLYICSEASIFSPPDFHLKPGTFLNPDYVEIPYLDYII